MTTATFTTEEAQLQTQEGLLQLGPGHLAGLLQAPVRTSEAKELLGIHRILRMADSGPEEMAALCERAAHVIHHASRPRFSSTEEQQKFYQWAVMGERHRLRAMFQNEAERIRELNA